MTPLAHSAPDPARDPQTYADHVQAVHAGAIANASAMVRFSTKHGAELVAAVAAAATFHDLGKLDPANQRALLKGREGKLPWDHIDAGVAHLSATGSWTAAWLVRSHHAPGLPERARHFRDLRDRKLRGRRSDRDDPERHDEQIERTDHHLMSYLTAHQAAMGTTNLEPAREVHGLPLRLALSCLVDADHTDTARFDTGLGPPEPLAPRWEERLAALDRYVAALRSEPGERDTNRKAFYEACRRSTIDAAMVSCEGPVGLGKTTAVTAYLLHAAAQATPQLRRLFVIAPYTNIITQTVERLRAALKLPGERPEDVVAEHHHRADFQYIADRDLAALWRAPIVVTTAVQFFETLASAEPGQLRKLHELPGSAVFVDETHAALPTSLWPQNWRWLRELADTWSCHFVFASGSQARFWERERIVGDAKCLLPELMAADFRERVLKAETRRIRYSSLGNIASVDQLMDRVLGEPGPRLLILNTVQSAAVVARGMAQRGLDTIHLSTALCPRDRDLILRRVQHRLKRPQDQDWTLVATSCVEAGVDLSFRNGFRERFSTASLIQVGGRVNRHGEFDREGASTVWDFSLDSGQGIVAHPAAKIPALVLEDQIGKGLFQGDLVDPAERVTSAMLSELRKAVGGGIDLLAAAERARDYPRVAELGRVIPDNTRLVVVDPALRDRIAARKTVKFLSLIRGSVQIWAVKLGMLGVGSIPGRQDLFWWPHAYDAGFLGYMAGALKIQNFVDEGGAIL
jgi:CRISPR-associated endonuclease/helicase Cas3